MFALKQGYDLMDQKALHKQIRVWCQETLIAGDYNEYAVNFSQYLQRRMTESILDKSLSAKYDGLFLDEVYEKITF